MQDILILMSMFCFLHNNCTIVFLSRGGLLKYVPAVVDSVTLIVLNVVEVRDQEKQEFQERLAFYDVLHATRTVYSLVQSANRAGSTTGIRTNNWVIQSRE